MPANCDRGVRIWLMFLKPRKSVPRKELTPLEPSQAGEHLKEWSALLSLFSAGDKACEEARGGHGDYFR